MVLPNKPVQYRPLDYTKCTLWYSSVLVLSQLKTINPDMFNTVMCNIAMGLSGWNNPIITTEEGSKTLREIESSFNTFLEGVVL